MLEIVLTLVFSTVMLLFMSFPAIKIVDGIEKFMPFTDKWRNITVIFVTILLSLLVGIFLRYA